MIRITSALVLSALAFAPQSELQNDTTNAQANDAAQDSEPDVSKSFSVGESLFKNALEPDLVEIEPLALEALSKDRVEGDIKGALASALAVFDGDKTLPGLVNWHSSFDAAVRAAQRSGKPVLHFQLLGQLDDAFC